MKYLHTMVRVTDLKAARHFYCDALGLQELRHTDYEKGRFTLVFLCAPGDESAQVELTYNWDPENYTGGRNFGLRRLIFRDFPVSELGQVSVTRRRLPRHWKHCSAKRKRPWFWMQMP